MTDKVKNIEKFPGSKHLSPQVLIGIGLLFAIVCAFFIYKTMFYVSTDDAFIDGQVIVISPKVAAHVLNILVDDNQAVITGTMLVELDSRDFEVRLQMASAELEAAKADDEQAKQDLVRYRNLSTTDEISKQQMDRAVLRERTAWAKMTAAEASLRQAELNVSYTKIISPCEGHVARKAVETGSYVLAGQTLMAVVSNKKWIVANFKETELTRIRPGQAVTINIDSYPGKSWAGHVDSIQRGTGARFSLFPPENAAGNFVKVVQRIPVKIVFDEAPDDRFPLAVGMSVVPEVKVR